MDNGLPPYMIEIKPGEEITFGTVVRRVGNGKDQQGCFTSYDDKGGFILVNVVDLLGPSYCADAGIITPKKGDKIFKYATCFQADKISFDALDLIKEWPLYKKTKELQDAMLEFVRTSYVPEQLIEFKKNDALQNVYVPIQEKFKIGRFKEIVNWDKVRKEKFRSWLSDLQTGDHLTYIGLVPQLKSYSPMFYTIGTKPHQVTHKSLMSEPFNFKPTHGGHIKALEGKNGVKQFLIDAGSSYLGKGINTRLEIAKQVALAMKKVYKEFDFIPIEGRGAFGTDQSY